jgi:hypothetical protein
MMNMKRLLSVLVVVVLSVLIGCERPTRVRLDYGDGLVFKITGDGSVGQLTVFSPRYRDEATSPFDQRFVIWKIEPVKGYLNGPRIAELKNVKYGSVPAGYKQIIPTDGHSPEPLSPGNTYLLSISTLGATGFGEWFVVKDRGSEFINLRGPCFQDDHGQWKRVDCPK